jgi:hypothetical protein
MIICRGTNDTDGRTDGRTNGQLFTSLFREKLSFQGARKNSPVFQENPN